LTDILGKEYRS